MQLVGSQQQIPTHLQLAEICRERFQQVAIQIQSPSAHQSAERPRQHTDVAIVQFPVHQQPILVKIEACDHPLSIYVRIDSDYVPSQDLSRLAMLASTEQARNTLPNASPHCNLQLSCQAAESEVDSREHQDLVRLFEFSDLAADKHHVSRQVLVHLS